MPDDAWEDLVERTVDGDVTPGSMFGCRGLRTGRKFFAIWWHQRLVVKLPAERLEELVAAGRAEPFEPMGGRRMNGWVVLGATVEWDPVVAEARAWTESQS
jgi:TfoX/Sxy family transcriptional regulator of competence genes